MENYKEFFKELFSFEELNAASNYEQRRRIRAQMRVVKKNQEGM